MNTAFRIGKDSIIDQGVVLGYYSKKEDKPIDLIVGDNARVRTGTVIYANTSIGTGLETGHNVVIREENKIGDDFSIWSNAVLDYGCFVGNNVKIHCNCYIAQFTTLEDNVFLAPGVTIANDIHPGCVLSKKCMKGPKIEKNVKVGVNVTISPFVTIGENSLIGSGSVVTRDVPPGSVVYGSPARARKTIYELKCVRGLTDFPYKKGERP